MPVRPSMAALITRARQLIFDPAGSSQFFADQDIQDYYDANRDDIRYEGEKIAPSIVNTASTGNQASTIFADYYSQYQYWEDDVVLQGYSNGQAWVVLTPTLSEPIAGHWQFENNVFTSGTVPGQLPPVFATGKIHDPWCTAADLLEIWGASLAASYDISVDGQSLRRSQLMTAKLTLANSYRRRAKPKVAKMTRSDVLPDLGTRRMRLLDSTDVVKGG